MPKLHKFLAILCLGGAFPASGQISAGGPHIQVAQGAAEIARQQADFADSENSLKRALALTPDDVNLRLRLASTYIQEAAQARSWATPAQQTELALRAEPELKVVLALRPQDISALLRLGQLYETIAHFAPDEPQREARYAQAADVYREAMVAGPTIFAAQIAASRLVMERLQADLQRVGMPVAELTAGKIADQSQRAALAQKYAPLLDTAIADANRASQLSPTNPIGLFTLMTLYRQRAALAYSEAAAANDRALAADLEAKVTAERERMAALRAPRGGPGAAIDGVYRIGGGVSVPKLVSKVDPGYTDEARNAKLQGTVVLQVVIEPTGQPTKVKVIRGLGLGLDESAVQCVQQWRFQPGEKEGHPVPVMATIEVNFRLLLPVHP